MVKYECPLCNILTDIDYDYKIKYLWCDDYKMKVISYSAGKEVV